MREQLRSNLRANAGRMDQPGLTPTGAGGWRARTLSLVCSQSSRTRPANAAAASSNQKVLPDRAARPTSPRFRPLAARLSQEVQSSRALAVSCHLQGAFRGPNAMISQFRKGYGKNLKPRKCSNTSSSQQG